jgi:hypothetical protein
LYPNELLRIGKDSKQVWIQAAYNPTFDDSNVFKVAAVHKPMMLWPLARSGGKHCVFR